jgi:hypothetical protein
MIAPLCILLADPLPAFLWGLPSKLRLRAALLLAPGSPGPAGALGFNSSACELGGIRTQLMGLAFSGALPDGP